MNLVKTLVASAVVGMLAGTTMACGGADAASAQPNTPAAAGKASCSANGGAKSSCSSKSSCSASGAAAPKY
jgi:hypothetical protein